MSEHIKILLLIIACAPILYWLSRIVVAFILYKLSPPHYITLEIEDKNGNIRNSEIVDVSKDKNLYAAVSKIYKNYGHNRRSA